MANVKIIPPIAKADGSASIGSIEKRRVAGYARVSTEKDEQFSSYEAQVEFYTRFIQSHADWEFVGIYTDEGITGTSTRKRTGFNRMVRDALDGKIDLIVTKSISRFARNTVDCLVTIRKLKEVGCECFFEKENIFTFDGKGELLLTIMSSLAQEESRSISDNVSWGIKESMRKGNAYVPYKNFLGYDKDENGKMKINPEQAIIVRRIYGMYLQGLSPYRIAQILAEEHIPSPAGKAQWFVTTIVSILKNEKYKGDALRQKTYTSDYLSKKKIINMGEVPQYYISDHHEAIISAELFEQVQKEFAKRGTSGTRRTGQHVFSQKIKCGSCGTWFGPKTWHPHTNGERVVWMCNDKYRKKKGECTTPHFSEEQLKGYFVSAVNKLLSDKELTVDVFGAIKKSSACTSGYIAESTSLQNEIKHVKTLIEAANKDDCKMEDYLFRLSIAERRLKAVDDEIANIMHKKEKIALFLQAVQDEADRIEAFDLELWNNIVDHIIVYSNDDIRVVFKDGTAIKA